MTTLSPFATLAVTTSSMPPSTMATSFAVTPVSAATAVMRSVLVRGTVSPWSNGSPNNARSPAPHLCIPSGRAPPAAGLPTRSGSPRGYPPVLPGGGSASHGPEWPGDGPAATLCPGWTRPAPSRSPSTSPTTRRRPPRCWCWCTARSTGREASPACSAASATSTRWPMTGAGPPPRHLLPVHTTLGGHVDDLLTVIDDRPAVLVGHSYGGIIALDAALRPGGPGPILAIAAYEPPLPSARRRRGNRGTGAAERPPRARRDREARGAAERFFRRMVGDSAWERLPDAAKADRRADGAAPRGGDGRHPGDRGPIRRGRADRPHHLRAGTNSLPHRQCRQAVDWLVAHTPAARLVEIAGAGHRGSSHPSGRLCGHGPRDRCVHDGGPGPGPAGEHRGYADQDPKGTGADAKGNPP